VISLTRYACSKPLGPSHFPTGFLGVLSVLAGSLRGLVVTPLVDQRPRRNRTSSKGGDLSKLDIFQGNCRVSCRRSINAARAHQPVGAILRVVQRPVDALAA